MDRSIQAACEKKGSKTGGFSQQNLCGRQGFLASGRTTTSTLTLTGRVGQGGLHGRGPHSCRRPTGTLQGEGGQGAGISTCTVRVIGGGCGLDTQSFGGTHRVRYHRGSPWQKIEVLLAKKIVRVNRIM